MPSREIRGFRPVRPLAALACAEGLVAAYAWLAAGAAPGLVFHDCGEFAMAAASGGIPHPPGAPTWCLLATAFVKLGGFADAARGANLFSALGGAARDRYNQLGRIWARFAINEPNLHLNMIGVRGTHAGRGLGRLLLDHVHARSVSDPDSTGVTLTTESRDNVPLYEHLGYRLVGHEHVSDSLATWGFFRPDAE